MITVEVIQKTSIAFSGGIYHYGDVFDVDRITGIALVDAGVCKLIRDHTLEPKEVLSPEQEHAINQQFIKREMAKIPRYAKRK